MSGSKDETQGDKRLTDKETVFACSGPLKQIDFATVKERVARCHFVSVDVVADVVHGARTQKAHSAARPSRARRPPPRQCMLR